MAKTRPTINVFTREDVRPVDQTPMLRTTTLDADAQAAVPEYVAGGGTTLDLLYGDPESTDGGGMSLVRVWFGSNYPVSRHAHSVDCLYYIVAGDIRIGRRRLGVGEGFFVSANAPYGYTVGPDGVELLEFRSASAFDTDVHETAAGWVRVLDSVRANRNNWTSEVPSFGS